MALLEACPDCGVAYCRAIRVGWSGQTAPSHRTDEVFEEILPGFLRARGWPTNAPLWRLETCTRVGGFTGHAVQEDLLFDVKAGVLGIKVAYCPEDLCVVRDLEVARASGGGQGYSAEQWRAAFEVREEIAALLGGPTLRPLLLGSDFARSTFQMARQCAMEGFEREGWRGAEIAARLPAQEWVHRRIRVFKGVGRIVGLRAAAALLERGWRILKRERAGGAS